MSPAAKIRNGLDAFPHLPRAPIVEAVLHWQAASGEPFDKSGVQNELQQRFPDYDCRIQNAMQAAIQSSSDGVELRQRTQWDGFRLTGRGVADRYVARFKRTGVVFSRLAPYECWETFEAEGMRFLDAYLEMSKPPKIERLGVRFINQIRIADGTPANFLRNLPTPPQGIEVSTGEFFYHDTYHVAGHSYQIDWVRTLQPTPNNERVLIVDIDVSTDRIRLVSREALLEHLTEMRSFKNRLFFSCMTEQALTQFGKTND